MKRGERAAEDNSLMTLRIAELASAKFGWPLHVVEDAGHVPHIEQPDTFLQALRAALA